MPIFRFLILGLAIWIAFRLIQRLYRNRTQNKLPQPERYVDTVACQQCGVHIPRNEALQRDAHFYCSAQHSDADGAR